MYKTELTLPCLLLFSDANISFTRVHQTVELSTNQMMANSQ